MGGVNSRKDNRVFQQVLFFQNADDQRDHETAKQRSHKTMGKKMVK